MVVTSRRHRLFFWLLVLAGIPGPVWSAEKPAVRKEATARTARRSVVFADTPARDRRVARTEYLSPDWPDTPVLEPYQPGDRGRLGYGEACTPWCIPGGCAHFGVDVAVPFGASVTAHMDQQIANGRRAQLVLYRYDFHTGAHEDPATLNRFGERRLERLLPMMKASSLPLIIQPVPGHPDITEARRVHVLQRLSATLLVPVSDDRVIVGDPPAPGLRGVEAVDVENTLRQQTRSLGASASSETSGQSSFGAGSSGTSGR